MDRRVKERLVGASILVVLIVLIVPALLSGPKPNPETTRPPLTSEPEPVRTVTVDLATSRAPSEQGVAEEPSVATAPGVVAPAGAPPGGAPPSVAAIPSTPGGAPMAAPVATGAMQGAAPQSPLESPGASPTSKPPLPARSAWSVQLGSFAARANADKLTHQLKAQGFAVYVLSSGSGSAARYRVRVGPAADRAGAAETAAKLRSLGHPSSIVAP